MVSIRHFSVFLQTLDFDDDEFDNIEEILDVFENIQQELMREGSTIMISMEDIKAWQSRLSCMVVVKIDLLAVFHFHPRKINPLVLDVH